MSNLEKYKKAFCEALEVEESQLEGLEYQAVPTWDSVGHMSLVAMLEETFDIMMDTDDVIDLSSFEKGQKILADNYNIEF